jgi:16S rRNA (cytosine967-C5)-methyltransferase
VTPAARLQAAIECLDQVIAAARDAGAAADTIVQRYFATRRYAGSKDRRAVRDLVFAAIRALGERPVSGRAAMIGYARAHDPALLALFGSGAAGGPHGPGPLQHGEPAAEPGLAPAWLRPQLVARFGPDLAGAAALLDRAPLDLRVNALKATREDVLALHPELTPTARAPLGLRAESGLDVAALAAFQQGMMEVQDEGSQLAALAVRAQPGETIVDLCAGAGGKALAIAGDMAGQGRIIACDIDRGRLQALVPRAERAGAAVIETLLMNPGHEPEALADLAGQADGVIVDAPCSGSGTWRRNPESRWRLTPDRLARLTAMQDRLLDLAAGLLRPGGRLTYVTCSVLPLEGEGRFAALLARHPQLQPDPACIPGETVPVAARVLLPGDEGCDGFFIATARLNC